jgi:spermidine synthase
MSKQTTYSMIAVLFVISGATGLAYQIAWFKYLSLFLGNTTYAQTIVLATFMGGLAIGATLWGRRADRAKAPLRLYGALEFFIGIYCVLYPILLGLVKVFFISTVHALHLQSDGTAVLFLKLLMSVLTLLFPTILMGGTLPVLVRFISESVDESGKNVATLYFLNSFGAVVGSLLGGFFLVPMAGLQVTVVSAGIVNILIASAAFGLTMLKPVISTAIQRPSEPASPPSSDLHMRLAIGVAGISGLAAMIYEVAWVRLLIAVLGSSTYSYTLMLVAFISGITIGSWIVMLLIRRLKNLLGALAVCQILVGISMALTLPLYGRIPYYFWQIGGILTRSDATYPIFLTLQFLVGFTIMIVPTIFLGMSLPLASRIATRSVLVLGKSVGTVFSINTLGTVIGSLGAGLVLIPLIGVRHAIEVGLFLNLLSGVVLTIADTSASMIRRVSLVVFASLGCLTFVFGSNWNQVVTLSGVFRQFGGNRTPPSTYAEFEQASKASKTVFYKEGSSATVGVVENPTAGGVQDVLIINGKADASSIGDLPTQVLLGQVPMMLHPHPDTVLVIGLGSGVTIGSVLTHPVKSVESVEISPEVVDASRFFERVNNRPLDDPRVRLYIDDALAFLNLSKTNYDVIISEPSNPWIAGIGNLYTVDFFEQCKKRLRPHGIMVQWFHLYEIDDETFKLVVRTFRSVFPHVSVWQSLTVDMLLVGSQEGLELHEDLLQEKLSLVGVKQDLERIKIPDVVSLLSMEMVTEGPVREYASAGPLNTEDKPFLEYWAPKAFFVNRGANEINRFDERLVFGRSTLMLEKLIRKRPLTDEERLHIGLLHAAAGRGNIAVGYSMLFDYLKDYPKESRALVAMADLNDRMNRQQEQSMYLERAVAVSPNDPALLAEFAWDKFQRDRAVASSFGSFDATVPERILKQCIQISADTVDFYRIRLGDLYFGIQQFQSAFDNYLKALQLRERYAADRRVHQDVLLLQLAKCYRHIGDPGRAAGYALQAVNANPKNEEARDFFYSIYLFGGNIQRDTLSKR